MFKKLLNMNSNKFSCIFSHSFNSLVFPIMQLYYKDGFILNSRYLFKILKYKISKLSALLLSPANHQILKYKNSIKYTNFPSDSTSFLWWLQFLCINTLSIFISLLIFLKYSSLGNWQVWRFSLVCNQEIKIK